MLRNALDISTDFIRNINKSLASYSPTTVIAGTIAATFVLQKTWRVYRRWNTKEIMQSMTDQTLQTLERVPYIGTKIKTEIDNEVNGLLSEIQEDVDLSRSKWDVIASLPEQGLSEKEIRKRFSTINVDDKSKHYSGMVYTAYDKRLSQLLQSVYASTALINPMHSEWPLIHLMEAEVISMCQQLLHGVTGAPGIVTHGGTSSILEACKAYVLHARSKGIDEPEIIVPESAHIAFDKAAKILNARLIKVPVDSETGAADIYAMQRAITNRTCLMVGSAPSFPFGIIDPIEQLAEIAEQNQVPLHVDACLGGFITAFAREAGFNIPLCDFVFSGVTSISIDTHKYGQTPKGTSVLLFREHNEVTPAHVYLDWTGGLYATPGIDGSRSGSDIAILWTVLCYKGRQHYAEEAKKMLTLQHILVNDIQGIDGIYVPYQPQLSVIPIQAELGINPLLIADHLQKAGWSVNVLQTPDQQCAGFHFCLTPVHTQQKQFANAFISALGAAVRYAKENPTEQPVGMVKAYGALAKGVPHYLQERIGRGYLEAHYSLRPR